MDESPAGSPMRAVVEVVAKALVDHPEDGGDR